MLNRFFKSWPNMIVQTMKTLRVLSLICAVFSVCFAPTLNAEKASLVTGFTSAEKAPVDPSEKRRDGQDTYLLPVCFMTIPTPQPGILEQDTGIIESLTHRDYTRTGAARAPPFFS